MSIATLTRRIGKLEAIAGQMAWRQSAYLHGLASEPERILSGAGLPPDPWQRDFLRSAAKQVLLLCCRQAGKSTAAAAFALRVALLEAPALILLLSPTQRQSSELFRKARDLFNAAGKPVPVRRQSALQVELANGSRLVCLPGSEGTIRGYSGARLLVIDEAARVSESLYRAVRPMLAVSQGRLVALSTPFGKRGWFHDEWHGDGDWLRVKITADQCPRIPREFLEEERRALGERWWRQEYQTEFSEVIDAVFSSADIRAALCDDVEPLFPVR